ncbi:B3 domain-containing protein REM10-like [Tasmannia lanceolata]|uniref:B3 domain-containing protein REM10-like n=1 Tax=Tasmannia lanceolata TaxID=3420 RepID=UPI00406336E3
MEIVTGDVGEARGAHACPGRGSSLRQYFGKIASVHRKRHFELSIPIAFHKYLVGEKGNIAVLKSTLGKSWRVKVRGHINGVFFEDGWEDFVVDHGLCSGDILVFRYEGNMVFDVTIFDKTACEKNYYPLVLKSEIKIEKQREMKNQDHVEASKVLYLGGQMVVFEGSSSYKPKAHQFVATIKRSNLKYDHMTIPKAFLVANNLFHITKITLKDPERRLLPVTVFHKKQKKYPNVTTFFSGGWKRFARWNKLKKGDECIFELVAKDVMNVRICRR